MKEQIVDRSDNPFRVPLAHTYTHARRSLQSADDNIAQGNSGEETMSLSLFLVVDFF